jgi:glycosyltransferase involved in cell wall biosynthesis
MITKSPAQIRVLHIVGGMVRGGVETWLMHLLRHIDRDQFQMDLMVHTTTPCAYDDEVRALGSRILPCLGHARPWIYARNFRRIIATHGPYDIVHSHVHHYSGYTLRLAQRAGVPVRIAHSHNDLSSSDYSPSPLRRIYLSTTEQWIRKHATIGLAASNQAAKALFGSEWRSGSPCRLLYYGIDLEPFRAPLDPTLRTTLRLPSDGFVIGHVGRFVEQKNHVFLLKIMHRVLRAAPKTYLLLVGDGPLRPAIERQVVEMGLTKQVVFAGLRSDTVQVLLNAMDVFVMPSLYEGLPLAGLEAQAAGLPCIFSDTITQELDLVPDLIQRLSLSTPASIWADCVLASRRSLVSRLQGLKKLLDSPFNIANCVTRLEEIYQNATASPSIPR